MNPLSALLAAMVLASPVSAQTLCEKTAPWPSAEAAETVFAGVQALEPGLAGDGPHAAEPVSMNADVLGMGAPVVAKAGPLEVKGTAICVRGRPEWLGLELTNSGSAPAAGRLRIALEGGGTLAAPLPEVAPGQTRLVMLRASHALAGLDPSAISLQPDG